MQSRMNFLSRTSDTTPTSLPSRRVTLCRHLIVLLAFAFAAGTPVRAAMVARRIVSENGDPVLYPSYLKVYDGKLYFRANNLPAGNNVELWEFDGNFARLAAEINPGPVGSDPSYLEVFNGKLYFSASVPGGSRLWQYDSLAGATLAPGGSSNPSLPQDLFAYGGNLYFRASRFGAPSNIGI
jgi:ELWxxDGT repeat protein